MVLARLISISLLLATAWAATGCGGGTRAVRGSDVEGLDYHAMSTGLDKRDLQQALHENMKALEVSPVVARWRKEDRPAVAALPMRNETSEHIDGPLEAMISDVETELINWGAVKVISMQGQAQLMQEIRKQTAENGGYDQSQVAHWGSQIGARYIISGKVFSTDERVGEQRRVQYYMFMQVLDLETGELLFQNKVDMTKAIISD